MIKDINIVMKAITPSSYQKIFQITPSNSTDAPAHRAIFVACTSGTNSLGLVFNDGTGVTLANLGTIGTTNLIPIIAKQVISASGLTAYGMI